MGGVPDGINKPKIQPTKTFDQTSFQKYLLRKVRKTFKKYP